MRGGMVTAVLCPGPSLRGFLAQPAAADTYIGVNHAAEDWPCHYWAVADAEGLEAYTPARKATKPRSHGGTEASHEATEVGHEAPTVFTSRQAAGRVPGRLAPYTVLLHEDCRVAAPSDLKWNRFTMTTALVLAELIGAAQIRIYGCDWQGGEYFKPGAHSTAEHFAERWIREKEIYSRVVGWLKTRRVSVERCFVD